MPDFSLESAAGGTVVGIDEAGRGPWAGPVVAAAVILDLDVLPPAVIAGLDDSKKIAASKREALYRSLTAHARFGIGSATVEEIDAINILQATLRAMARAVKDLDVTPDLALVDGNREPRLACPSRCVIEGDTKSLSIAAASIVAKVTRDRIMVRLARGFPGYGWERNAGYGTPEHRRALEALGVTPHHRKSFAPIIKILGKNAR